MQKQHLHALLPILVAVFGFGCGPQKLPQLNPYLHGNQKFEVNLTGLPSRTAEVEGWRIFVKPALRGDFTSLEIEAPTGQDFEATWCYGENTEDPIVFTELSRTLHGLELRHPELELNGAMEIAASGDSITLELSGESSREITLHISGETSEYDIFVNGKRVTDGELVQFENATRRANIRLTEQFDPRKPSRSKLDVLTESDETNRAIALLTTLIPHAQSLCEQDSARIETWAQLAEAQWIAHCEAPRMIADAGEMRKWTGEPRPTMWPAYRTLFSWGAYPSELANPLRDAMAIFVASKFERHQLQKFSSPIHYAQRLREAALFNFAEQYLTEEQVGPNRTLFREETSRAVNDVQRELKLRRGMKPEALYRETSLDESRFLGADSSLTDSIFADVIDSVSLFRAASWGNLTWLFMCGEEWLTTLLLPWDLEQARLRHRFDHDPLLRETPHWNATLSSLADSTHLGLPLPSDAGREDHWLAAASEIETITKSYLGIQPNFQQAKLTLDPRLPKDWGRTRAVVPYSSGELYVDYGFAQANAVVAYDGIQEEISCLIHFPLPSGRSMPGQFTLNPDENSKRITLTRGKDNEYRLIFDDADFPE